MFTHQQCLFGIQKLGRIQSLKSKYSNNILSSNIFPKRQKLTIRVNMGNCAKPYAVSDYVAPEALHIFTLY